MEVSVPQLPLGGPPVVQLHLPQPLGLTARCVGRQLILREVNGITGWDMDMDMDMEGHSSARSEGDASSESSIGIDSQLSEVRVRSTRLRRKSTLRQSEGSRLTKLPGTGGCVCLKKQRLGHLAMMFNAWKLSIMASGHNSHVHDANLSPIRICTQLAMLVANPRNCRGGPIISAETNGHHPSLRGKASKVVRSLQDFDSWKPATANFQLEVSHTKTKGVLADFLRVLPGDSEK